MVRILQVAYGFEGGVGRLLVDYCSRIKDEVNIDFLIGYYEGGIFEKQLIDLGFKVFRLKLGLPKGERIKIFDEIFSNNKYDIIHIHGVYDYSLLKCAKKHGIKVRIAHSHNAYVPGTKQNFIISNLKKTYKKMKNQIYITDYWACGKDAGISAWGIDKYEAGKVHIMKNAIEVSTFAFSEEKRLRVRTNLSLNNKFVIGNVGRLADQKNHEFLINVFVEFKKIREDAVLLLIGDGELEAKLKNQVKMANIQNSVIFMGTRNDIPDLLNAMDVFVLTSKFEGLPVAIIEAQANGLHCVVADTVTKECSLLEGNRYLSLECDYKEWAGNISTVESNMRLDAIEKVQKQGYDINFEAPNLLGYYKSLVSG